MKAVFSALLIIGFLGVIFPGTIILDMEPNHGGVCVAFAIDGTACPTNISGFATHHIAAIQSLSTALVSLTNWNLLLITFFSLSLISLFLLYKDPLHSGLQFLRKMEFKLSYSKQKIFSWLSLFELSPSYK